MAPEQQNVSPAQMLEMMKEFAKELRKPTELEQQKLDEEKARKEALVKASVERATREQRMKDADQSACSHMKPHPYSGKTRIVAPLHSDGLHHPICLFCRKEFKPFAPGADTIQMGMSLDDYQGVTPQIIEHWGSRFEKEHAVTR